MDLILIGVACVLALISLLQSGLKSLPAWALLLLAIALLPFPF